MKKKNYLILKLSLWGGEVVLQNLDLRLDVLEDELQLPFEFLSGHIHELIIHVPWTKITSEPIQITINTIEFVLKLKDPNATTNNTASGNSNANDTTASSSTSLPESGERKKRLSKIDDNQQQQYYQQGYVPGLVNKIINNIAINCHNIILKYIEEDIVVSMNIQLLSFNSANDNWQKSFIDFNNAKIIQRKLIQISDLTICLDKRNSIGLIDVCQEPILYRCSLEMRIIKKLNLPTKQQQQKSSFTRIDILSNLMEINITSIQFPMVMRLLLLMKLLKYGELNPKSKKTKNKMKNRRNSKKSSDIINLTTNDGNCNDLLETNSNIENESESYLTWAWNLIPTIFPIIENDDDNDGQNETDNHNLNNNEDRFYIGLYLKKLNITLKSSDIIIDSIVQTTRKIRYNPILKISLDGIYNEINMIGKKWFNITAGISKISLESLGNYATSTTKTSSSNTTGYSESLILFSDSAFVEDNYLENSLFQNNNEENLKNLIKSKFTINIDNHLNEINENSLLKRTPIFAFDMFHFIDIPTSFDDDYYNKSISDYDSDDYEYSNLSEQSLIRLFLSSITIKYNSSLLKIINAIDELIQTYNYPPYLDETFDNITTTTTSTVQQKIPPPSIDDYDALMKEIPKKICKLTLRKIKIEFYPILQKSQQNKRYNNNDKLLKKLQKIPFLNFICDNFHLNWIRPLYPTRLVYITSQLPDKPQEFMNSCYDLFKFDINNLNLQILSSSNNNQNQLQNPQLSQNLKIMNFLNIPQINGEFKQLLMPNIWPIKNDNDDENELILQKFSCNIKYINFEFTKFELQIIYEILSKTILQYDSINLLEISYINELNIKKLEQNFQRFKLCITELEGNITNYREIINYDGKITTINGFIIEKINEEINEKIFLTTKNSEFCQWIIQWPIIKNDDDNNDSEKEKYQFEKPPFIAVLISDYEIVINKKFINLLSSDDIILPSQFYDMEREGKKKYI